MLIRPELQALRSDDTPQRQAQADLQLLAADWRASRLGTGLDQAMVAYARGELLKHLPPFARLFTPGDASALRLSREFVDRFAAVLAAKPWGQVPLPCKLDDSTATIVLAAAGNAALVLQAIDGTGLKRRPAALTASFSPGETHDHVLAGSAQARLIELVSEGAQGAELAETQLDLGEGQVTQRDSSRQVLLIDAAPTTLVTLKLQRRRRSARSPANSLSPTARWRIRPRPTRARAGSNWRQRCLGGWGAAMPRRCWRRWPRNRAVRRSAGNRSRNALGSILRPALPRLTEYLNASAIRWLLQRRRCARNCSEPILSLLEPAHAPRNRTGRCAGSRAR